MRVVVGLGNPGLRYRGTRHNLGFEVLDRLEAEAGAGWKKKRLFPAWIGRRGNLILVKPATYVNLSGGAVRAVLDYFRLSAGELLVVVDDVNLPAGTIRIRAGGGAGGHHGLESIIRALSTRDFARLRIGVGGGKLSDLTGHVLSRPGKKDNALFRRAVTEAGAAVEVIATEGVEAAMNRFNKKQSDTNEEVAD